MEKKKPFKYFFHVSSYGNTHVAKTRQKHAKRFLFLTPDYAEVN